MSTHVNVHLSSVCEKGMEDNDGGKEEREEQLSKIVFLLFKNRIS